MKPSSLEASADQTVHGLFSGPAPRVRTTLASAPFLDVFVAQIVEELRGDDPFALSDALILLPNRRAVSGLVDAFAEKLGGAALLPTIRPLGDLDDDPDVWGADPVDLPPAIDPTRRRLELAALIRARDAAEGGAADPVRALAFADELCRLMDSAAAGAAVDWSRLDDLVEEREFAEHWRRSARFLQIVATFWPKRLAADGLLDPADRRAKMLMTLAAKWEEAPPETPIVIAGSTGSILATRVLMQVVARLPRGAVVLPGLDVDLDERAWTQIGPQHPQSALKETLKALGVARDEVALIGARDVDAEARRVLVREALVPADATADWPARLQAAGGADLARRGAAGLTLYEAESEEQEAAIVALLLREALETETSAALVTPDANLARRVEAKLARWSVSPLMSQSRRLETTPCGLMLALIARLALDEAEPVSLAGLLAHPLATFGMEDADRRAAIIALEHACLRGPRRHSDIADLLAKAPQQSRALVSAIRDALAPLRDALAGDATTLSDFAGAIADAVERAATNDALWVGADGAAGSRFLQNLIEHGGELGGLSTWEAQRAFAHVLAEQEISPSRTGDPRIAILGPLEGRLQRRDLVILGALNEGVWPAPPPEDPFLSRPMREALGLVSPDARMGLAAHDFAQLASAPRVAVTRALRRDGAPTVASRWLWRLKTLLRAASGEHLIAPPAEHDAARWARALDAPRRSERLEPAKPCPPASARLKRISVTDAETLIRDPYALYARRILGLRVLDPIGAEPGASHRGSAIHRALETFDEGEPQALLHLIDSELARAGFSPAQRAFDRARLAKACATYAAWLRERRGAALYREAEGRLTLPGGEELVARADRIEISGRATIVDYKTGATPTDKEVSSGLAPQLPLEAAMLARGAFKNAPAARAAELIYWRFGGADPGARSVVLSEGAEQAAEAAFAALVDLLARYARDDQPFLSKPRTQFARPYTDYDLLARRKEWADAGDAP